MMRFSMLLLALFAGSALAATAPAAPQPDVAKAKQTAETVCGACHGPDGNSAISANPKLAGQHEQYLQKQLLNFKSIGGKTPERNNNPVMVGMAAPLSEADIKALSVYFAQQKLKPETAKGDKASLELATRLWRAGDASRNLPACAGCHGPTGAGMPAQYPRLQGQFAAYTDAQLKAFRAEARTNDAARMMRTIAARLSDKEIAALSDYIAGLR